MARYWKPKSERGQGPLRPFTLIQETVGPRSFTTLERAVRAVMPDRGLYYFVIDNRLPRYRRGQAVVAGNDPRECDFIKEAR